MNRGKAGRRREGERTAMKAKKKRNQVNDE
jgi:hypothetical protein